MKRIPISILAFLVSPVFLLRAEGPPVDVKSRTMTVPHEVITISESQREEIETLGTLTLATAQWAELRKHCAAIPKRIESVLPVTYNDCTCDIGIYAIQIAPNQVAVAHEQYVEEDGLALALGEGKELFLRVDHRGQFHYRGTLVPFQKLLDAVRASKAKGEDGSSWLVVEFPLDFTRATKAVASRIGLLTVAGESAGWTVQLNDSVRDA